MSDKLPENCPTCRGKMAKGYVSASPDVYWSEKKVTWRFWRTRWEALLGGRFAKWIQPFNAEAYRCPNCKVVLFSYEKKQDGRGGALKEMQLVRVTRVVGWLKVGISIFVAGGVLQLVLAAVALAKIESPTSHMWATLSILAWLLLITGSLIIYSARAKQREHSV